MGNTNMDSDEIEVDDCLSIKVEDREPSGNGKSTICRRSMEKRLEWNPKPEGTINKKLKF